MKDSTRRALRSALQVVYTVLTTGGLVGIAKLLNIDISQEAWTAFSAALLPVVVAVNNALEDAGKIPAVLKYPTSDEAPDGGHPDTDAEPAPAVVEPDGDLAATDAPAAPA